MATAALGKRNLPPRFRYAYLLCRHAGKGRKKLGYRSLGPAEAAAGLRSFQGTRLNRCS